ncbi:MAG: zinc-binding dehydrogenase [Planctomycetaceae bacterium]|nr:zinc-binding dehydrogenase [Planctomycetaceae bacterium]
MADSIPDRMHALVLHEYCEDIAEAIDSLKVEQRSVPPLKRGQLLVRIEAAPCNPSDLLLLQGKYGSLKTLPTVPGWEGAGTVVASGGGPLAWWLMGKRVACGQQEDRDGTWAQYVVANAAECIPLKRQLCMKQAASLIINPLTAMGLLETARRGGHRAAIQTAGASQLGRMLVAMASESNFPIINVVRREAQVELLQSIGATHVLNSSDDDFVERLGAIAAELQATTAFEAIGGEMTGTLFNVLPEGSTVFVYGALSEAACDNIDPIELIFRGKTVTGFYLGVWLKERGSLDVLRAASRAQKMLIDGRIETKVQRTVSLEESVDGLRQYVDHMTDGKLLIMPQTG